MLWYLSVLSQSEGGEANSAFYCLSCKRWFVHVQDKCCQKTILHHCFGDEIALRLSVARSMNEGYGFWVASSEVCVCPGSVTVGIARATRSLVDMFIVVKH